MWRKEINQITSRTLDISSMSNILEQCMLNKQQKNSRQRLVTRNLIFHALHFDWEGFHVALLDVAATENYAN